MAHRTPHKPHRTEAEETEQDMNPGRLPVEPDLGPTLPAIPVDPDHEQIADPEI